VRWQQLTTNMRHCSFVVDLKGKLQQRIFKRCRQFVLERFIRKNMNRKQSVIALLTLLLFATSCHFYKEYDKKSFPTYSWNDGQEVVFTPKIDDNTKEYQISLGLRHHYGFQNAGFAVKIKMISPSGKETSNVYDLKVKDDANRPIGSCAGDMCDLETVILDDFKFEEIGEYKILISHNESGYRIPGIMEVGVIIDEKS
jgi:gliding motility-associated lipoprotein GldH